MTHGFAREKFTIARTCPELLFSTTLLRLSCSAVERLQGSATKLHPDPRLRSWHTRGTRNFQLISLITFWRTEVSNLSHITTNNIHFLCKYNREERKRERDEGRNYMMCCDYTQCHCGRNREEEGVYVRERESEKEKERKRKMIWLGYPEEEWLSPVT